MPLGSCRKLREGTLNAAAVTGIGPQNEAEAIARRREVAALLRACRDQIGGMRGP
jgi:hypothetical protein